MKIFKQVFHDITNINKKNIKLTIHKSAHRRKLLRWLYEVTRDFKYEQSTFGIAVYILDTYTQKYGFELNNYQLLGITSLFIAAKMEESKLKGINDYVQVTDCYVKEEEILLMERHIINIHSFDIVTPHFYLKSWHLEKMSKKLSLAEKRELLFSTFAYFLEMSTCKKSMYSIFLDGIKEAENILAGHQIPKDLQFYINNNRIARHIKSRLVINK